MKIAIGAVLLALALAYVPNHHEAPVSQPRQPATHLASHVATHPTPTRQAAPPPVHHATTHHAAAPTRQTPAAKPTSRYTTCDPGWKCGTCPDGSWWGYLDDGSADAVGARDLIFDDGNPCG